MPSENKTANIALNQWQANEYPKREDFNADNLAIDEALGEKLSKTGDGKDVTVTFDEAATRTNIGTGQKLSVLFGKIKKWLSDLTDLAFGKCGSDANQALYTTAGGIVTADKLPVEAGGTGASTAAGAREILNVEAKWRLLKAYTKAGAYTFNAPEGITELGAFVIGGGANGAVSGYWEYAATGGGSGHSKIVIINNHIADSYSVLVGEGGGSVSKEGGKGNGINGGSSSFNGITVDGGSAGNGYETSRTFRPGGSDGGQGSSSGSTDGTYLPAMGEIRLSDQGNTTPFECYNPFDGRRLLLAGGFASSSEHELAVKDDYGNVGSAGAHTNAAVKGTSYGCGGGAAYASGKNGLTATSAAGADGAVLIYGR